LCNKFHNFVDDYYRGADIGQAAVKVKNTYLTTWVCFSFKSEDYPSHRWLWKGLVPKIIPSLRITVVVIAQQLFSSRPLMSAIQV